jgi:phosphonate degradation associated HDIG domain protein
MTPEAVVAEIFALFAERGGERYGERVTQLDHALQCAELARREGAPRTLIAAALLHDWGHLIENRGHMAERDGLDGEHEALGALSLSAWFPPAVTQPIALHVAAKRWLCAREPGYFEALSAASQLSLELQGGPFAPDEADAFLTRPYAAEAIRLRRWDDFGKQLETDEALTLESFAGVLAASCTS